MVDEIQIQVNGEPRGWRDGGTVADLLKDLAISTERVAVELNLEILDRKDFGQRSLRAGDRVEILGFIGGGSETKGESDGCERQIDDRRSRVSLTTMGGDGKI